MSVDTFAAGSQPSTRMPVLYLSHGAPPLADDPTWTAELAAWSSDLPRPKSILVVSAHWESAPLTVGATEQVPLTYDFGGFPQRYYQVTYDAPGAPELAMDVHRLLSRPGQEVYQDPNRGLDHGAYVPLVEMYPEADIPVLQMSLPTQDPYRLLAIGARLAALRDEGVLVIGSGFMTHGLPFLTEFRIDAKAPTWSVEFDAWAAEALTRGDIEELASFRDRAPGMPYAHPTVEHYTPLFITLGAATDLEAPSDQVIDGYWMGLSKRSLLVA
jgi:4,5-DOPA dioxygenase extradiol